MYIVINKASKAVKDQSFIKHIINDNIKYLNFSFNYLVTIGFKYKYRNYIIKFLYFKNYNPFFFT